MSTITRPSGCPPSSLAAPMKTPAIPGEERGVMRDVSYDLYDLLSNSLSEHTPIRLAYDGKDVEVIVVGPIHDQLKELIGEFVNAVSDVLEIDCRAMGSTTWKRAAIERGLEADQCYYFDAANLAASAAAVSLRSNDVADYPNPDLAVEIDISLSKIDRPGIYAALKVFEVWRCQDEAVTIEQLQEDGSYATAAASRFLHVRPDEVTQWLTDGLDANRRDWRRRLREWVRDVLSRRAGTAGGNGA